MSRHTPASLVRDASLILSIGLCALTLLAAATYRPGGPQWPHTVVDGSAWLLVVVCGSMYAVAAVEIAVRLGRRPKPSW